MSRGLLAHFPTRDESVIADILERHQHEQPDRTCAVFPEETWTFAHAARQAWQVARGLIGLGVRPGDPVSVWTPTGPALLKTWFGVNAAGAVYAPISLEARGAFLQHALDLAASRVLVAHPRLLGRLQSLELKALELILVTGEVPDADLPWRMIPLSELSGHEDSRRPRVQPVREPWDDFAIIYTSGTTGPSKGVRLSYASHRLYADSMIWPDVGADDRLLMPLPLSHVAGTAATYAMLQRGGAVVLPGAFDARTFWEEARRYRATVTFVLHGMVDFLLGQPAGPDDRDHSLRYVYLGPLRRSHEFRKRFGVNVYVGFGMTELPVVLRTELNPSSEVTIGRQFNPDYECRLVDEHDIEVPAGAAGELIVRHRHPWVINSGYKDMPEATARSWRNGWFHTGDRLRVDAHGDWIFVDRAKDAIRRRGENISSYEVEAEVISHPDVDQATAVAVPNPDIDAGSAEEEIKIVVVPVEGRRIDPPALIEYLVPRMPRYMIPRFVEVVAELPMSPSFKVKKAELRAAGITSRTWDRQTTGIRLKREQLS
jgi:crotonobetaine/carnitine-CoA ligase